MNSDEAKFKIFTIDFLEQIFKCADMLEEDQCDLPCWEAMRIFATNIAFSENLQRVDVGTSH